ncbi:TIGR03086 family metal-binding protein [Streptomyces sp. SID13031]|uniref:TIGR03086 family metal-binding protein n=1 Tax=Streptomyces sp. SID13031 TaxID=2706046 RepID=UPI0013C6B86A|nr:TIGR03086 family metal-binding protein [Streptomyces sp. SID13031]NEA34886.1 TIGR03086 family protein [Streptomyces sp. SID13031]
MGEIAERYRRRAEAFELKVAAVRPEQWGNQSPCEKWSARDVLDHIVAMNGYMLMPVGRTLAAEADALKSFQAARAAVEAVLDDPELAGQECDTPAGWMTVEGQIDQVVSDDLVLHGWDLARATGQDEAMDPVDVERMWASNSAIPADVIAMYRTPNAFGPGVEVFGPEVVVPEDAPLQDRLLGFIGRKP